MADYHDMPTQRMVAEDVMSLASISSSMFSTVPSHSTMIDSEGECQHASQLAQCLLSVGRQHVVIDCNPPGFVPRTKICLVGDDVTPTLEAAAEVRLAVLAVLAALAAFVNRL